MKSRASRLFETRNTAQQRGPLPRTGCRRRERSLIALQPNRADALPKESPEGLRGSLKIRQSRAFFLATARGDPGGAWASAPFGAWPVQFRIGSRPPWAKGAARRSSPPGFATRPRGMNTTRPVQKRRRRGPAAHARPTGSPPHHFTTSPPHHLTTSPPHHLTTSPPHHFTTSR